jgi:hypothetical protein
MSAVEESQTQTLSVDNATLHAMTKAELDQSIATARAYPRDPLRAIKETTKLATQSEDTADDCIFAVPRDGKTIEGPSVRLAEILVSRWGNCRAGARIIDEGRDHITAQGVFHDLETNAAVTSEVRRRITNKNGRRYSVDMIGTTANAACSIALRNAVFKGIPKAIWNPAYLAARRCVAGESSTLANSRAAMVAYVQKFGVSEAQLLAFLQKESVDEIAADDIVRVRGLCSAIRDGETTPEEAFNLAPKPDAAAPAGGSAVARAKEALKKPDAGDGQGGEAGDEKLTDIPY